MASPGGGTPHTREPHQAGHVARALKVLAGLIPAAAARLGRGVPSRATAGTPGPHHSKVIGEAGDCSQCHHSADRRTHHRPQWQRHATAAAAAGRRNCWRWRLRRRRLRLRRWRGRGGGRLCWRGQRCWGWGGTGGLDKVHTALQKKKGEDSSAPLNAAAAGSHTDGL